MSHTYCQHSISLISWSFIKILHSHSEPHVNLRENKWNHNRFYIALFLLSFHWHSSETNINWWWFSKITHTYNLCILALTCNYSIKSEYSVQWIKHSLTNECPNHDIVHHAICSWIEFSLTVIWIAMTSTDSTDDLNQEGHAEKGHSNISSKIWEIDITYECIAYWMQSSMLFCCTEINKILRAVLSSEDAVLSMRTFTWSWCLPVSGVCKSA